MSIGGMPVLDCKKFGNPCISQKDANSASSPSKISFVINAAVRRQPSFSKFLFCRFGRLQSVRAKKNLETVFEGCSTERPWASYRAASIINQMDRLEKKLFVLFPYVHDLRTEISKDRSAEITGKFMPAYPRRV